MVNGGRHAFVPHGSDGITFIDTAAVDTVGTAYWWDKRSKGDRTNNSHDITWRHALVIGVTPRPNDLGRRMSGFQLGAGTGLTCIECHSVAVHGRKDASGFIWPEFTGGGDNNEGVWVFEDSVAHNNKVHGIFVWQNTKRPHTVVTTLLYRNGDSGIDHGAYNNGYLYQDIRIYENGRSAIELHANSKGEKGVAFPLRFVNIDTDGPLWIKEHAKGSISPVEHQNCTYTQVIVDEAPDKSPTWQHFIDCGLTPADFDIRRIHADTALQIFEGGQLLHEWRNGSWK